MKYIVKCRFCGRSYVVDSEVTGADFMCEACAGVNNIRDVEERVQEKKKKIDPDIANIQSFDISSHPVSEKQRLDMDREIWREYFKYIVIFVGVCIILLVLDMLLNYG